MFKYFTRSSLIPKVRFNSTSVPQYPPNLLSLKVGKIIDIKNHENALKLYVSQVQHSTDLDAPLLQICSGLVPFIAKDQLLNSYIVILTNLKTSKMRGEKSEAMLLAASKNTQDGAKVEIVRPPINSEIGDILSFANFPVLENLKNLKTKPLEEITMNLKTNASKQIVYMNAGQECLLKNSNGDTCFVDSLQFAEVH